MMNPNISERLSDGSVGLGPGRTIDDEMMRLKFAELYAAKNPGAFPPRKLPPPVRTGPGGIPGRPRLHESRRDSFSRELGCVTEICCALHRRPECLLYCWIQPQGFDTIDDGEITYTYTSSSSVVPNYSTDHTERRLARLSLEEAHHDYYYSKDHMERLARLALEAHHDYYSGEEGYMLVSLEKAVFKKSIDEYYITFTARQIGAPASDVKTVQAIVVNYFGVFDFVLYVKIITSDNYTCFHRSI